MAADPLTHYREQNRGMPKHVHKSPNYSKPMELQKSAFKCMTDTTCMKPHVQAIFPETQNGLCLTLVQRNT